jgi:hypothetical protein
MASGMLMVFDEELDIMAIFMETEDGKSGTLLKSPISNNKNMEDEVNDAMDEAAFALEEYTFTELGTKTILGYECQGFQMENDEMKMIMYMALDAPVSFNQIYGDHMKTTPEGFDPKWLEKAENSIVMEMEMINKKRSKYNTKMTCVALEKSPKTLVVSDYEFMSLNLTAGSEN